MISQPAMAADISTGLSGAGLLLCGSVACMLALRFAGYRLGGRAIVAGVIAGLLLGPTVFGRVWPERFESVFVGGSKQRADLDYARWLANAAPLAIEGLTEEARQAMREQAVVEIDQKQRALDTTRWEHQQPLRWLAMAMAVVTLLGAAQPGVGQRDRRQGFITPLSVGIWSFALPAAAAYICGVRWWETPLAASAMLAACVGIGPWRLSVVEREAADGAELGGARMMQVAGKIASMLAIALALWAAWIARGVDGLVLVSPLVALPLGWIAATSIKSTTPETQQTPSAAADAGVIHWLFEIALAALAALLCLHIDLHTQIDWTMLAMVAVLGLIADDVRWGGAFLGAIMLGGRPALRTMRLVMPAMAAGPTQLAAATLAIQAGIVPERFALPLLAGVLLIELSAPLRSRMAARLIDAERELHDAREPE